jgi:CheY-like chemotaxis protein
MLIKDSKVYEVVKNALIAAQRTKNLTQQLLTFAKGGVTVKEATSMVELIRETTELSLHGSNTKPEYHLAENLSSAYIDQGQIGQVLQNLVLNADQAMPRGGSLTVLARNIELSVVDPLPLAAGPYVKVSVVDQGNGMSAEVMAQIFEPYYTTKPTGHGLGLSITHSILQKHGGHMTVCSEIDVGTTFEFYLPALPAYATMATEQEQELARGTGRILLVDDEELIHIAVEMILTMLGYEVESVYDGEEALQAYKVSLDEGKTYDIVIIDLTIPGGMGGQEAIGRFLETDPKARVIVSSGYVHDPAMDRYAEYGFAGKIEKPVSMRVLAETVKRVLEEGRE